MEVSFSETQEKSIDVGIFYWNVYFHLKIESNIPGIKIMGS